MPSLSAPQLTGAISRIFQAAGVPAAIAIQVSASLVQSNLMGHDSHGVIRLMQYLRDLRAGLVDPHATIEVLHETPTTALLDAHWQFGQIAASHGMAMAIDKAKESHLAAVGIRRCYHVGRLGEYALLAAGQGLIGMVLCNSGRPLVAPFGGTGRALGPNPISWAVPAGRKAPFLLDFAATMCAEGKVRVARAAGKEIPEGWILDKDGQPTTNPADLYDGGVILPMAGHKGYALCLLLELLGGALTGHGCSSLSEHTRGNGVLMLALDVQAFSPLAEFEGTVGQVFEALKAGPTAPGFAEILIPGEPEFRMKEEREREGIPLPEGIWQEILREAVQVGIEIDPW
jgi:uncharacterized oxidoreductase